jgi:hypothetical protein
MALILTGAFLTLNFYVVSILWPIQAQVLYSSDVMGIGWLTTATGGGALLGDIVSGLLIRPLKYHKWQVVFYACAGTIFTAALAAVTPSTKSMAAAFVVLSGFMVGAIEAVIYTLCPLTCEPEDLGLAFGLMASARTAIPTLAVAIYITVLNNKLAVYIPQFVSPAAVRAGLPISEIPQLLAGFTTGNFSSVPSATPQILAAASVAYQAAYTQTFKIIYLSTIPWGCTAIFFAFFCPDMGSKLTTFVGRRLHSKEISALAEKSHVEEGKHSDGE